MKLLAFDTSSVACSVALLDTEKDLSNQLIAHHQMMPMQQGRLILPMIQELLESAALSLNQLDAIAFGCGPGSYTGARIASSVAQGLGYAANKPVIPISSLAARAQAACLSNKWTDVLLAVNAHMGEIYWAQYQVNESGLMTIVGVEEVASPDSISVPHKNASWYGVGDGWAMYAETLHQHLGFVPVETDVEILPTAAAMTYLAAVKYGKKEWVEAVNAVPVYLNSLR